MSFKIVVSEPKSRKAWQVEKEAPGLIGKKIGEKINGSLVGLNGFSLEITGGSDKDGFPMRYDLPGIERKKILLSKGPGLKKVKRKGMRKRKNVRGNTISDNIIQINLKVVEGEGDIAKILGVQPKKKEGEEAKKGEAPQEAKTETPGKNPKEEKASVEQKEEPKAEVKTKETKE